MFCIAWHNVRRVAIQRTLILSCLSYHAGVLHVLFRGPGAQRLVAYSASSGARLGTDCLLDRHGHYSDGLGGAAAAGGGAAAMALAAWEQLLARVGGERCAPLDVVSGLMLAPGLLSRRALADTLCYYDVHVPEVRHRHCSVS